MDRISNVRLATANNDHAAYCCDILSCYTLIVIYLENYVCILPLSYIFDKDKVYSYRQKHHGIIPYCVQYKVLIIQLWPSWEVNILLMKDITVLLYWTNMRKITSYWFDVLREITSYHPSLRLYLPTGSISKTRIKVRMSWAGLINSQQELSPNSPNI